MRDYPIRGRDERDSEREGERDERGGESAIEIHRDMRRYYQASIDIWSTICVD